VKISAACSRSLRRHLHVDGGELRRQIVFRRRRVEVGEDGSTRRSARARTSPRCRTDGRSKKIIFKIISSKITTHFRKLFLTDSVIC
jgi:hypothetical protein